MPMETSVRVLVLEPCQDADSPLVAALAADTRCEAWTRACTADEAVEQAHEVQPQLILVDDRLPLVADAGALARVCQASPGARVFVVTDVPGALALDLSRTGVAVSGLLHRDRLGRDAGPALLDATLLGGALSATASRDRAR